MKSSSFYLKFENFNGVTIFWSIFENLLKSAYRSVFENFIAHPLSILALSSGHLMPDECLKISTNISIVPLNLECFNENVCIWSIRLDRRIKQIGRPGNVIMLTLWYQIKNYSSYKLFFYLSAIMTPMSPQVGFVFNVAKLGNLKTMIEHLAGLVM